MVACSDILSNLFIRFTYFNHETYILQYVLVEQIFEIRQLLKAAKKKESCHEWKSVLEFFFYLIVS